MSLTAMQLMTPVPVTVEVDRTLDEALLAMEAHRVRHLPVTEEGELVGILSDRDLLEIGGGLPSRMHSCRGTCAGPDHDLRVGERMHTPVVVARPETELRAIAEALLRERVGCLPVVEDGHLIGIVTETDVLGTFSSPAADHAPERDRPVSTLMTPAPLSVHWYTTLGDARRLCETHRIRHLPVLEAGLLIGMVSDRDLRRAHGVGRPDDTPLDELMTRRVVSCPRRTPLAEAARLLVQHGISALPVAELDELHGIVTVTDFLALAAGTGSASGART